MKNVILFFVVCLSAYSFSACTDDAVLQSDINPSSLKTKSTEVKDISYFVTEDGALNFSSGEAFIALIDSLNGLSIDSFKEWEQSIHFKSYRSLTDNVIAEIQASEGTSNFNVLLQKYSDLVYLNEDSLVCPLIEGQAYRNITNEQGIFYAGVVRNMFNEGHLSAINMETNQPVVIDKRTRATGKILTTYPTMTRHKGGVSMSRGVSTYAKIYEAVAGGYPSSGIWIDIVVWGLANNNKYETECYIDDVTVRFEGISDIQYSGTRSSNGDYSSFTWTFGLYMFSALPYKAPICLHYRARTRGLGNEGMPYNFHHGTFVNVSDHLTFDDCNHIQLPYYK